MCEIFIKTTEFFILYYIFTTLQIKNITAVNLAIKIYISLYRVSTNKSPDFKKIYFPNYYTYCNKWYTKLKKNIPFFSITNTLVFVIDSLEYL